MTQREVAAVIVRFVGAYLVWENLIALLQECMMPSGTIANVPGIEGQVALQIAAFLFGIYLLVSGRFLVNLLCKPV